MFHNSSSVYFYSEVEIRHVYNTMPLTSLFAYKVKRFAVYNDRLGSTGFPIGSPVLILSLQTSPVRRDMPSACVWV